MRYELMCTDLFLTMHTAHNSGFCVIAGLTDISRESLGSYWFKRISGSRIMAKVSRDMLKGSVVKECLFEILLESTGEPMESRLVEARRPASQSARVLNLELRDLPLTLYHSIREHQLLNKN